MRLYKKIAEGDIELMRMRISEILHHLKNKKKMQKSRQEYLSELEEIFCSYYGYTRDLMEVFLQMFAPNELFEFLEANEKQRPTTIRINTLKTRRKELA